ncbi:OsmC family protein [Anaerobacillus sp. MEB173]|uniref:OsmC family protein n=1 Tax=Anaerobacillus sp. MEB173 TaxID=3383345 RepID=UPI003F8E7F3D
MEFKMKEHSFVTEVEFGELEVSGDAQYGYRPYQLLVSAIAVCSGGILRKVLQKKRLSYEDIQIKTEVTRNEAGAQEIEKIHMHFIIKGLEIEEEKMEKILAITEKNCSMVQSVKESIEITESFEMIK